MEGSRLRALAPALLVAIVVVADLLLGDTIVFGLLAAVPLMAAALLAPVQVTAYGAVCLLLQVVLGFVDDVYDDGDAQRGQLFRLVFTVVATVVGLLIARQRLSRERRLAQVTAVATAAQLTILRPLPPRVGPWRVEVGYQAATAESQVGGDLYDAVRTDSRVLVLVGDVRGKGLPAVSLASRVLGAFRFVAEERTPLLEVLAALDRTVARHGDPEEFVTAVLVELSDDGTCTLLLAGHPPPLLLRGAAAQHLQPTVAGPPLGLGGEAAAQVPLVLRLEPADRLLLYTDGLIEARRPQDRAFFPLPDVAGGCFADVALATGMMALRRAVTAWTHGALDDDVAVLVVQRETGP